MMLPISENVNTPVNPPVNPLHSTFGLRSDVWGWTFDGANLPMTAAALTKNYDPLDDKLDGKPCICPFCAKEISRAGDIDVLCRTMPPMRVSIPMATPVSDKMNYMLAPVQFYFRYHRDCYDSRTQDMIEKVVERLRV